ncbi:hypothetical protein, variant 1 [Exophiala mesophila]|uniref:TOG domain-containing protein n=2 Tax=Exophiala mesophila TaxID=212818 RepID=A0A0D1YBZ9_EXOME|nr:uncharacterized protein PV10_01890 [Exophiala mesophila]XP_016229791.1 hypothetical protein, variant 1 [Exophiala mesophila]KIV98216.1 hypothetical protein PV10_01890 [Exophiala mesophila]KIV98217.1 hypothetical protein, variant 1 [Exophiala mesophila]
MFSHSPLARSRKQPRTQEPSSRFQALYRLFCPSSLKMADGQEEDFSQLPLSDRFVHKNWKVRKEAYEAAAKAFEVTPDESDPAFRPFLNDPSLWKAAVADSNVAAQQEGLASLCAFLKYGGREAATRSRSYTLQPISEKGLSSTRPAAKASALEALLLYVEIDKSDPVIEELIPALSNKQPKVIAATLSAITSIFHAYGIKVVEPKPVLKSLPKVFAHADKNVRAEAQNLTVELYRWLKDAMKVIFWNELKPVQQQDLEKLFEKVKEDPPPKQERLTRSQQAAIASAPPAAAAGYADDDAQYDEPEDDDAEVNAFDLAEPVDVISKMPANFQEMIASTKWKDRKEALDALFNILNTPRIKEGPYDDLVRSFAKCMKDANIAVVTVAANCTEKLAQGLRKGFAKYRATILSPMLERLKEKKQSVADAIGAALDAVFTATSLTECLEETLGFLPNKNPQVKLETAKFLIRCLRTTRDVPSKPEQKSIADAATKLLTESTEPLRAAGAEMLGTLMKILGERAMNPYLEGLDDIRTTKIKEFFDVAEVKAKEKPKLAPAPPKPAPGAAKKVVGGKRPVAKKPAPVAAPPPDDPAPLQPKPTAKALPKPGGLSRPGLAQPSGLKLGGLKKPGIASGAASPQRRVMSPPMSADGDEEAAAPSPSKFGLGRGGLAGRPLQRPAATPHSPGPMASVANGMSAMERAELEELRAEKERLSALSDSLRSSNAKLSNEIAELQNQNAQLIEDHTRDVLQIKAKETQLVRARGECDVLKAEIESVRKESERYKREVSRLGRESFGREKEESARGRAFDEFAGETGGIYEDHAITRYPSHNGAPQSSRPQSSLQRAGSTTSTNSARLANSKQRPQSGYTPGRIELSPSEEKENGGFDVTAARRKISPPVNPMSNGSGRSSPQRPTFTSREPSDSAAGGSHHRGEENWKRAAEVTSQLKARIEAMKARQGLAKN